MAVSDAEDPGDVEDVEDADDAEFVQDAEEAGQKPHREQTFFSKSKAAVKSEMHNKYQSQLQKFVKVCHTFFF